MILYAFLLELGPPCLSQKELIWIRYPVPTLYLDYCSGLVVPLNHMQAKKWQKQFVRDLIQSDE